MSAIKSNQVTVTVDAAGGVACVPEHLTVKGCDAVLKFTLKTAGCVFPKEGAVKVDKPGKQFPFPSRTLHKEPTKATLYDHNSKASNFKFTVTVQRVANGQLIELDPVIINEP